MLAEALVEASYIPILTAPSVDMRMCDMESILQETLLNRRYADPLSTYHHQHHHHRCYGRRTSLAMVAISHSSKGGQ